MADTWELTKYVEAHPDNHEQRWRLVKKLYKEGDYRMALENLQILMNDWEEKPNVRRYLAATYTRMSRVDEAVVTLEKAVQKFPDDLAMQEQLAVAYAQSGDDDNAAALWSDIAKDDPDHRYAKKAMRKTVRRMKKNHKEKSVSNPAHDGIVCLQCGTKNLPEALNCQGCSSRLDMLDDILGEADEIKAQPFQVGRWLLWACILICAGFIAFSIYRALESTEYGLATGFAAPGSFSEFMLVEHRNLYLIVSGVLLVVWPLLLLGAEIGAGLSTIRTDRTVVHAMAYSTFAVALAWIPGVGLVEWIPMVLAVTLGGTVAAHRENIKVAVTVWAVQWCFLGVLLAALVGSIMDTSFLRQIFALDGFSREDSEQSALHLEGSLDEPHALQWFSTGSSWLDQHASRIGLHLAVSPQSIEREMTFVLKQGDELPLYERVVKSDQYFYIDGIIPGVESSVQLLDSGGESVRLDIIGVLPVESR
ncbi:MAG: tetratricopeptide repeat protein [Candidatus Hydrogenedentota bacterium]